MRGLALLAAGLMVLNMGAFAEGEEEIPAVWGYNELTLAQSAAVTKYVVDGGSMESLVGYSLELSSLKNSAKASVKYRDADGVKQEKKYFCHVHAHEHEGEEGEEGEVHAEIDCH